MKRKITAVLSAYLALAAGMFAQSGTSTIYVGGVPTTLTQAAPNILKGAVQVPLTNALLIAMNTTPIPLIGATSTTGFGAGTLITIDSCTLDLVFATGAFASGGVVTIGYGSTQATVAASAAAATIASTVFTTFTANQAISVAGAMAVTVTSLTLNKPVSVTVGTGNFTNASSGTSTGILDCTYTVHLGLS